MNLVLPRELTIYSVSELRPTWLNWLAQEGAGDGAAQLDTQTPWLLDAAAVEEVDAAGMQLLVALSHSVAHSASMQRHQLLLINASPTLRAACVAMGLSTLLAAAAEAALPGASA